MRAEQKHSNIDALVTINKEQLFKKTKLKQRFATDAWGSRLRLQTLLQRQQESGLHGESPPRAVKHIYRQASRQPNKHKMSNFNHKGCFFFFPFFASEMKLASFSENPLPLIVCVARGAEVLQNFFLKKRRIKESVHDSEVAS